MAVELEAELEFWTQSGHRPHPTHPTLPTLPSLRGEGADVFDNAEFYKTYRSKLCRCGTNSDLFAQIRLAHFRVREQRF